MLGASLGAPSDGIRSAASFEQPDIPPTKVVLRTTDVCVPFSEMSCDAHCPYDPYALVWQVGAVQCLLDCDGDLVLDPPTIQRAAAVAIDACPRPKPSEYPEDLEVPKSVSAVPWPSADAGGRKMVLLVRSQRAWGSGLVHLQNPLAPLQWTAYAALPTSAQDRTTLHLWLCCVAVR